MVLMRSAFVRISCVMYQPLNHSFVPGFEAITLPQKHVVTVTAQARAKVSQRGVWLKILWGASNTIFDKHVRGRLCEVFPWSDIELLWTSLLRFLDVASTRAAWIRTPFSVYVLFR